MNGSSCDKLDNLISASLYINIENEAKAFMSKDVSAIKDDPKLRRTILRNAATGKKRSTMSAFRITMAACLAATILLLSACMCIPKIRESIWNAIVEWYDDHIAVHFSPNVNTDSAEISDNKSTSAKAAPPSSIEKQAYASCLPDGYYAGLNERSTLYQDTFFYDRTDTMQFRLMQSVLSESESSELMVDAENDSISERYINGNRGVLVEYPDMPGLYYLVWQDESYQYSLYGTFASVSELMQIAEGIRTE